MSNQSPDPRRWLALMVMLSATLLSVIDFLIVNIALPSIRSEMRATDAQIQLTVACYGLAFAVCLITGGRLGDIYGRKRMFQIGMTGFTIASMLCGFAHTAPQLVVFRIVQGFFAALMTPQVLASVQVLFEGRERDVATGLIGAAVGIGSFLANVLGGWLIGANLFDLSWRPIFFVNVPIGIAAIILSQFLVRESKSSVPSRLDPVGALLSALGLFLLIFPLAEGRERGWPLWAFVLIALSGLVGWIFVRYENALESRGGSPLVSTDLLKSPGFARGLLGILLLFSGISSFVLVLTLFLQDGLGVKPQQVGIIFAALSVSFLLSSVGAVKVLKKLGSKTLLIGLGMMQLAQAALIVVPIFYGEKLNPFALMPLLFIYGLGQGLSVPQIIRRTMNEIQGNHHAGAAAGMVNTTQQTALTLGVSVVGTVFFAFAENHQMSPALAYGRGMAAAFVCNFILIAITRSLVKRNLAHQDARNEEAAAIPIVIEA